jgi:hypothetical protein
VNRAALDCIWKEIGKTVAAFLKSRGCSVKRPPVFRLRLWNNFGGSTAELSGPGLDIFRGRAPTVEGGVREILTQIHERLGHDPNESGDSLPSLEALVELMWEVAEMGAEMSICEVGVGQSEGPVFCLDLCPYCPRFKAELYFADIERRYGDPDHLFFHASEGSVLDALEEVVGQARDHLSRNRPPLCD